jgi:hypothetical protein
MDREKVAPQAGFGTASSERSEEVRFPARQPGVPFSRHAKMAPQAGFEPATLRLTARCRSSDSRLFVPVARMRVPCYVVRGANLARDWPVPHLRDAASRLDQHAQNFEANGTLQTSRETETLRGLGTCNSSLHVQVLVTFALSWTYAVGRSSECLIRCTDRLSSEAALFLILIS